MMSMEALFGTVMPWFTTAGRDSEGAGALVTVQDDASRAAVIPESALFARVSKDGSTHRR